MPKDDKTPLSCGVLPFHTGFAVGGFGQNKQQTMNTKPISSARCEGLLTMLRTAKNRKIKELQESLPSIRQQLERSVDGDFLAQFNLVPVCDRVRSLRRQVLGPEKPSDSLLAALATAERELRLLGFDVSGVDKVFIGSEWRHHERQVVIDQQVSQRLKDERERHLRAFDDAMSRVKTATSFAEAREIVDSVLA